MKSSVIMCLLIVSSLALVACKKTPEELEKEREEAFLRQHNIEQIKNDEAAKKAYIESLNRPSVLSGVVVPNEDAEKVSTKMNESKPGQADKGK